MINKKLVLIILIVTLLVAPLFGQSGGKYYDKGDQMFTFRAGPVIPAFFYFPYDDGETTLPFFEGTHLKVGGYGSIRYQGFVNSSLALGGELGYYFNYDNSKELFTSVPFQAKLTYFPLQGTFEIPLSVGVGFGYNSYSGGNKPSYFSSLFTAEVGFSWFFKENWGLTLSSGLQLYPEIYLKNHPNHAHTALAGVMPITLSISYRSN